MTYTSTTASMATGSTVRIPIVPFGLSLSIFAVITYVLCVLYGLVVSDSGMHQLLPLVLPRFTWITWPSFFIGLVAVFLYGWYVAVIFAPLYNYFVARFR